MKSFILQLEAERRSVAVQANAVNINQSRGQVANRGGYNQNRGSMHNPPAWKRGPHANCFRCSQVGHEIKDSTGQYYCYICRKEADHKGTDCPMNRRFNDRYSNTSTSNTSNAFKPNSKKAHDNKTYNRNNSFTRGRGNSR